MTGTEWPSFERWSPSTRSVLSQSARGDAAAAAEVPIVSAPQASGGGISAALPPARVKVSKVARRDRAARPRFVVHPAVFGLIAVW